MINYCTGASGFIGGNLAKKLDITPILHEKIDNIKLLPYDNFFFLSSFGNLASQKGDNLIYKANVGDLITILDKSKDIKFKSFVYISSSSVGLPTQTVYSKCKKMAEEYLLTLDLPILIIRPFSVTGRGEQAEHLIPTLIKTALSGKTINFVPNATHDFIDVEDLVDGIIALSEKDAKGIFELGTGISTSNQEVLELVEKITGKKVNVNIVDSLRPYDTKNWVSTDFRAREFGWMPKKSLEQSIREQYNAIK
ncbi:NAD(P)-dependent oxidoreductase [Candidatus Dojkabacteria bacterium]|jgi:nucleoside-diphosphate-sugar epimerase|nr:NAD(P)-dependent oxidoreductase [Candidatus Dojkabacteria bacterium]